MIQSSGGGLADAPGAPGRIEDWSEIEALLQAPTSLAAPRRGRPRLPWGLTIPVAAGVVALCGAGFAAWSLTGAGCGSAACPPSATVAASPASRPLDDAGEPEARPARLADADLPPVQHARARIGEGRSVATMPRKHQEERLVARPRRIPVARVPLPPAHMARVPASRVRPLTSRSVVAEAGSALRVPAKRAQFQPIAPLRATPRTHVPLRVVAGPPRLQRIRVSPTR